MLGLLSPHREARLRRRELRQRQQAEEGVLVERMKELQTANEQKQRQLEVMRKVLFQRGPLHFGSNFRHSQSKSRFTPGLLICPG